MRAERRATVVRSHCATLIVAAALALVGCGSSDATRSATAADPRVSTPPAPSPPPTAALTTTSPPARKPPPIASPTHPPFAVGERVVTFIDPVRTIRFPGTAAQARRLVTLVRYPAQTPPSRAERGAASAPRARGPFPLVVFGHGFAVTPAPYAPLLDAWARAGYVVAAPLFPLENAGAPGGPDESDLINQPRDMSLVISRMVAAGADPQSFFAGLIDRRRIAVTGQSDGGETALAVAYDRYYVDRRVRAAMILSGATIPGLGGFDFPAPSPPLLATQATADNINPPSLTNAFFDIAPAPKYLLTMFGSSHLGPYTSEQPQLGIVERVTIAFLDRYVNGSTGSSHRLIAAGDVPGTSVMHADP